MKTRSLFSIQLLILIVYHPVFGQWTTLSIRSQAEFSQSKAGGEGEQFMHGFARCLTQPNYVYAAHDCAGSWRSVDGGESWIKGMDKGLYVQHGQSIEVDPVNPDLVLIVVDNSWMKVGLVANYRGLYRSEDGGTSWNLVLNQGSEHFREMRHLIAYSKPSMVNSGASPTRWYYAADNGLYSSDNKGINWTLKKSMFFSTALEVIAHPTDINTVFVAATDGLYRSTDGGGNLSKWKFDTKKVTSVLMNANLPNEMYVAVSEDGLYYSNNNGDSFTKLMIKAGTTDVTTKIYRAVMNPGFPEQIYFISKLGNGIYKSCVTDDGGKTTSWKPLEEATTFPGLDREKGWRRWIDNDRGYICPNPLDKTDAVAHARGTMFKIKYESDLYRVNESATGFTGNAACWWNKAIAFHPFNPDVFAFFCMDIGPRVTSTAGNWFHEPDPNIWKWKYQDNIIQWTGSYSGDFQPLEESKVVVASVGMYNGKSQLMRSTTNGVSWDNVVTVVGGDVTTHLQGYEFVGFDPELPNIVYAGNCISTDAGLSFQPIVFPSSLVSGTATAYVFGVSKNGAGKSSVIALHSDDRKILRSDDHGTTWYLVYDLANSSAKASFTDGIPTIAVDPQNPNTVYTLDNNKDLLRVVFNPTNKTAVTTSLHVFDALPAWVPAGVKTYNQIRNITVDPVDSKVIYISFIASGVPNIFRSVDAGASWQSISDDFPHLPGTIAVNPHNRKLYRGSLHGSAFYPAPTGNTSIQNAVVKTFSLNFEISSNILNISGINKNDTVNIWDMNGRLVFKGVGNVLKIKEIKDGVYIVSVKGYESRKFVK